MTNQWITDRPIAHRGLHFGTAVPENSLLAFQKSIDADIPIECDIQFIKDETFVVFHDDTLERLTGVQGKISDLTLSHLKNLYLYKTKEQIPTLEKLLTLVNGRVPILIEIKGRTFSSTKGNILKNILKDYSGEIALQSFNPMALTWCKKNIPHVPRGMISYDWCNSGLKLYQKLLLRYMFFFFQVSPSFISIRSDYLDSPIINIIREKTNIPTLGWAIKSAHEVMQYKKLMNNFIFENFVPK